MLTRFVWIVTCGILAVSACTNSPQPAATGLPATVPTAALTPYLTATLSAQSTGVPATPTAIPTPTATPQTYVIARGDDLWGISLRHQVPLEVILTANPSVDPNFLKVGTELLIPAAQLTPTPGGSTPTPVAVQARQPDCYPDAAGGVWCFLLVHNTLRQDVENLSGAVVLSAGAQGQLASQPAYPPIDLLPAGRSLPLAAYFAPPLARPFAASGQLYSALLRPAADSRYLPVEVSDQSVLPAADHLSARVTGSLALPGSAVSAGSLWVVATAYGALGEVVGVRKWEAGQPLAPGHSLAFDFTVYSLGPEIETVDVLVQAKPR